MQKKYFIKQQRAPSWALSVSDIKRKFLKLLELAAQQMERDQEPKTTETQVSGFSRPTQHNTAKHNTTEPNSAERNTAQVSGGASQQYTLCSTQYTSAFWRGCLKKTLETLAGIFFYILY